jgi:hypothetical protein
MRYVGCDFTEPWQMVFGAIAIGAWLYSTVFWVRAVRNRRAGTSWQEAGAPFSPALTEVGRSYQRRSCLGLGVFALTTTIAIITCPS